MISLLQYELTGVWQKIWGPHNYNYHMDEDCKLICIRGAYGRIGDDRYVDVVHADETICRIRFRFQFHTDIVKVSKTIDDIICRYERNMEYDREIFVK